jgi:O-antigen ligase
MGETRVVSVLVSLVGFIAVCSLVVYFAYPELGRMHAWLGSEFGENNRIQGIAGTPNGLGSMTAMSLIFTLVYFRRVHGSVRRLMLIAAVPSAICLIMSNSRMSIASLIVCATVYFAAKGNRVANVGIIALGIAALAALFISAPDMFLSSLARSGEASEITSATGRSEIWAVVLEHVFARPLTGYGYAMSTSILPMDPRLFSVAAHSHNMYLEVLFSGGAMSFSLLMVAVASTLYVGLRAGCFEPTIILLFYLLRGLTEPAPFDNLPSFAGYSFFLAVAFIAARARRANESRQQAQGILAERLIARCRANLTTANKSAI